MQPPLYYQPHDAARALEGPLTDSDQPPVSRKAQRCKVISALLATTAAVVCILVVRLRSINQEKVEAHPDVVGLGVAQWSGARQAVWTDGECLSLNRNLKAKEAACKRACEQVSGCTAINVDMRVFDCELWNCSYNLGHIINPVLTRQGWQGYSLQQSPKVADVLQTPQTTIKLQAPATRFASTTTPIPAGPTTLAVADVRPSENPVVLTTTPPPGTVLMKLNITTGDSKDEVEAAVYKAVAKIFHVHRKMVGLSTTFTPLPSYGKGSGADVSQDGPGNFFEIAVEVCRVWGYAALQTRHPNDVHAQLRMMLQYFLSDLVLALSDLHASPHPGQRCPN